jgi:hypothetical protein
MPGREFEATAALCALYRFGPWRAAPESSALEKSASNAAVRCQGPILGWLIIGFRSA